MTTPGHAAMSESMESYQRGGLGFVAGGRYRLRPPTTNDDDDDDDRARSSSLPPRRLRQSSDDYDDCDDDGDNDRLILGRGRFSFLGEADDDDDIEADDDRVAVVGGRWRPPRRWRWWFAAALFASAFVISCEFYARGRRADVVVVARHVEKSSCEASSRSSYMDLKNSSTSEWRDGGPNSSFSSFYIDGDPSRSILVTLPSNQSRTCSTGRWRRTIKHARE
jgi:hypothetical protein